MSIALAFEVSLNGKRLCAAGLRGKPSVLHTMLSSVGGTDHDELALDVVGLDSVTKEHLTWVKRTVSVGDEIVISVVESSKITRVRARFKSDQKVDDKLQKAYPRKTAKKFGYKLVKTDI